ncbi:MAG: STAS domain-containing protein [Acidobacteriia bacterium]|nr:STAS domain-containing protein [Terriglobia bacterium]
MAFKASVRHTSDVAIVDLAGKLTLGEGCGTLRETIKDAIAKGDRKILVNLKETTYIDSSGLGELVSSYASVTNAGGQIKLLNAESRVHDLLTVTKLYSVFESFSNEAVALISFTGSAAKA